MILYAISAVSSPGPPEVIEYTISKVVSLHKVNGIDKEFVSEEEFEKLKKEKQIEKSKDIIDEISEDETLSLKEKKEMLQILRQEEINNNTKAKPKQNLKT